MLLSYKQLIVAIVAVSLGLAGGLVNAQSGGSSGSISGTVLDPDGAVVPNATVEIQTRSATLTDQPQRINPGISASRTYPSIRIT